MDTLSLTDSSPILRTKKSDRLFFDRFCYSIKFHVPDINVLRNQLGRDSSQVSDAVTARYKTRKRFASWGIYTAPRQGTELTDALTDEDIEKISHLLKILDFFNQHRAVSKVTFGYDCAHFYTSDLDLLNQLLQFERVFFFQATRVEIDRPRDTVLLRKSDYQYRTYLRDVILSEQQQTQLRNFLKAQPDLRCCPSLQRWVNLEFSINRWSQYLHRYYFIDHNDSKCLLIIAMIIPGIIKKTLEIKVNN